MEKKYYKLKHIENKSEKKNPSLFLISSIVYIYGNKYQQVIAIKWLFETIRI